MNIYDIAKDAGVSITTVSRVLNNKSNVSEKTRKKIQAVLDKYQYQPSAIARGLVAGSMKTVAIFVVDVQIPHYATTSFIMEQRLSHLGYMVLLCNTGEDINDWKRYLKELAERKVDGIILIGSIYRQLEETDVLEMLGDIPIVMANGSIDRENIYSVLVDDERGTGLACTHLWNQGRRKVAYVKDKQTESADRKERGFLRQMKDLGIDSPENDVYPIPYSLEGGAEIARTLFRKGYDGIVFGEDLTAVGAVNGLIADNIKVPEEVAVTGYNNSEYTLMCRPQLTTVNNKAEVLSELTVKMLVDVLSEKEEIADLVIIPELVVRGTS